MLFVYNVIEWWEIFLLMIMVVSPAAEKPRLSSVCVVRHTIREFEVLSVDEMCLIQK